MKFKSPITIGTKTVAAVCAVALMMPIFGAISLGADNASGAIPGWGDVINPDGDCTLTMADGKLAMALPGTDHAMMPERGKTNAPRVMQDFSGEFDTQVKVSGDFPAGAKTSVRGRSPYQDAGLLLWLDAKNNLKLSRARVVVNGATHDFFNLEFRNEGHRGEVPFPKEAWRLLSARAVYLRLQVHADMTTAAVSADGTNWITTSLQGGAPGKLQVGVIAENNTLSPLNVTFENFSCHKAAGK